MLHEPEKKVKKLNPVGDILLLKSMEFNLGNGKILEPTVGNETPVYYVVEAVGEGKYSEFAKKFIDMRFQVGDVVLAPAFSGRQIKLHGQTYILTGQDTILAKVEIE